MTSAIVAALLVGSVGEGLATISNGDFSSGLTGWTTTGSVTAASSFTYSAPNGGTISPQVGSQVTELITDGGISRGALATFLGVPSGQLKKMVPESEQSGSAMKQTFTNTVAGAQVTFDWNMWTRDYYPPYNDVAFVTLTGPGVTNQDQITVLGSLSDFAGNTANTNGPANGTGWNGQASVTLPSAGSYTLGFGILHAGSALSVDSYLHIDNVAVAPEPSTALAALLALAATLLTPYRREVYRRRHRPHSPSA